MTEWEKRLIALLYASEVCFSEKLLEPSLILLYSAIDIFGSLETENGIASRKSFEDWVIRYLDLVKLQCTASDIYGARCGLIHTLRPDSGYSTKGNARLLGYAWGTKRVEDLREASIKMKSTRYAFVQIEDLHAAVREGLRIFLDEVKTQPVRLQMVEKNVGRMLNNLDPKILQAYIKKA